MQEICFKLNEKNAYLKKRERERFFHFRQFDQSRSRSYSKGELIYFVSTLSAKIERLESENAALKSKLNDKKIEEVNRTSNQPTSKMAEFEKAKGKKEKRKRKKKREKRPGSGNRAKREPDQTNHNPLAVCPTCESILTDQPVIELTTRIVEDIPAPPKTTIITEEVCEKKWCPECKEVVSSTTDSALPKSDVGLNALILIAYFWVVPAMSLPGIQRYLAQFYSMTVSTSGLSKMMIRLADVLLPVYLEILEDVKGGKIIFADETGWSIKGVLHWMWAFANERAAFYWVDRGRGSLVVQKILGDVFSGVLVTDAWCAYYKILCSKQTCMAHLLRKIRKFHEAYPNLKSILKFKKKLQSIIMSGEKLQSLKTKLSPEDFQRKLDLLKARLDQLLLWPNPNPILQEIIKKVARQKEHILTFVEHDGVPTTNNYGEYTIKKGILKRKISGGSMSENGANAYCILASIAQTCHLRKLSFVGFLLKSLIAYIKTGIPMTLSEYESQLDD
jgi:hypothetical protein